jgi:hypothetical protein
LPLPSQVLAEPDEPVHVSAPHCTLDDGVVHVVALVPSHVAAHGLFGDFEQAPCAVRGTPLIVWHLPMTPGTSHAWQMPVHALSQQ